MIRKHLWKYTSESGSLLKVRLHVTFRSIFPQLKDMSLVTWYDACEPFLSSATSHNMMSSWKSTSKHYKKPLNVSTTTERSFVMKESAKGSPYLASMRCLTTLRWYGYTELQTVSVLPLQNPNIYRPWRSHGDVWTTVTLCFKCFWSSNVWISWWQWELTSQSMGCLSLASSKWHCVGLVKCSFGQWNQL